jgi:hypothetical protein
MTFRPGDRVRLREVPPWVATLSETSQSAFRACVGLVFPVVEVLPDGVLVLDVSDPVDRLVGGCHNDIRVEPQWVETV